MNKTLLFLGGVALVVFFIAYSAPGAMPTENDTTVPGNNSRFQLLNGTVSVTSSSPNATTQQALFRIDGRTGDVWVLQMQINDPNNPVIVGATFVPVTITATAPIPMSVQQYQIAPPVSNSGGPWPAPQQQNNSGM